jgi:ABC-type cobalt transport system substrate-binding protein
MKKISLLAALVIASFFAASAYAGQETITDGEKISGIINDYYPELKDYYEAGVMSIESLKEQTLGDGSTEYGLPLRGQEHREDPHQRRLQQHQNSCLPGSFFISS